MFKISMTIVGTFTLCLIIFFLNKSNINGDNFSKIIILISLLSGMLIALKENKKNIDFYVKKKCTHRIKFKIYTSCLIWVLSVFLSFLFYKTLNIDIYSIYFIDSLIFSPLFFIFLFFWITYWDARQNNPEDEYYLFLKKFSFSKKFFLKYKIFILSNLIKIFFIPFIYGAINISINKIINIADSNPKCNTFVVS